jgi:hypothetical protein
MKHLPNKLRAEVIKMVKLVNLTPHPVVLVTSDGRHISLPSEGVVRVREVVEEVGKLEVDGVVIPLRRKFLSGELEGLPQPEEGTVYIVSFIAAQKAWELGRTDVMAPGDPVRNEQGHIVGVSSLYTKP